jgi:hypothetical protein
MNCVEFKYRKNKCKDKLVRLEIAYDGLSGKWWYAHTPVEVEPLHQPKGEKKERRTDRSSVPAAGWKPAETP